MTPAEQAWRYLAGLSSPIGHWRQGARKAILAVVGAMRTGEHTAEAVLAACDKAYPYGPREHFPYKAWLQERGVLRLALGLTHKKSKAATAGLLPLFERRVDE